jgi:hypothetical protein
MQKLQTQVSKKKPFKCLWKTFRFQISWRLIFLERTS